MENNDSLINGQAEKKIKFDRQTIILGSIIVICIAILFPPWKASNSYGNTAPLGYYFLFSGQPQEDCYFPSIDYGRLFLEIILIGIIAGLLLYWEKKIKQTKNSIKDEKVDNNQNAP